MLASEPSLESRIQSAADYEILKMFDCPICEKKYAQRKYLNRHYQSAHLGLRFYCELCGSDFARKHYLQKHIESSHGYGVAKKSKRDENSAKREKSNENRQLRYFCVICGVSFVNGANLSNHIRSVHLGIQAEIRRWFDCSECEKTYKTRGCLKRHVQSAHLGVRLSCALCGNYFVDKPVLRRHIQSVHLGIITRKDEKRIEKWYDCSKCGKTFTKRGNLSRHDESAHSGVRFCCQLCGKDFAQKSALKSHIQFFHLGMKFSCKACGKGFSRRDIVKKHFHSAHSQISAERDFCAETFDAIKLDSNIERGTNDESPQTSARVQADGSIDRGDESRLAFGDNSVHSDETSHRANNQSDHFPNENTSSFLSANIVHPTSSVICPISIVETSYDVNNSSDVAASPRCSQTHFSNNFDSQRYEYLPCRACPEVFYLREDLAKHMENHDSKPRRLFCIFCKEYFSEMAPYQYHVHSHFQ